MLAIRALEAELGHRVPVAVTITIEGMGTMLSGSDARQFWGWIREYDPVAFGFAGRRGMVSEMVTSQRWDCREVIAMADAFASGSNERWFESPDSVAASLRSLRHSWFQKKNVLFRSLL